MDTDRRQSLRISNRLAFAWQSFLTNPELKDLQKCFGNPDWPTQRLNEISDGIRTALPMLPGETRDLVRLLEEKIDVVSDQLAYPIPSETQTINLSHEGLDFKKQETTDIEPGTFLGIHLALPYGKLICAAKVVHCDGQRVGVHLQLNPPQARVLSRYLLTRS